MNEVRSHSGLDGAFNVPLSRRIRTHSVLGRSVWSERVCGLDMPTDPCSVARASCHGNDNNDFVMITAHE